MSKVFAVFVIALFAAVVLFSLLGYSPSITGRLTSGEQVLPVYNERGEIKTSDQPSAVHIGATQIRKTIRKQEKPANATIVTTQRATAVTSTNRTSTSQGKTIAQQVWEALLNLTRRR